MIATKYDGVLAAARALVAAERRSLKAMDARRALPPGSRRGPRGGRLTTAEARWANAAEARDRCVLWLERELHAAGMLRDRGTCETCGGPADFADADRVQCDCGTTVCSACCVAYKGESYCSRECGENMESLANYEPSRSGRIHASPRNREGAGHGDSKS